MKDELVDQTLKNGETPAKADEAKRKKKYSKPGVIYQAPLEAMAATCTGGTGKVSGICTVGFS